MDERQWDSLMNKPRQYTLVTLKRIELNDIQVEGNHKELPLLFQKIYHLPILELTSDRLGEP